MITPSQLKEHEFKSAGRNAYRAEDVDSFIAELTVDYEKMFRENGDLIKRASLLADRLEKYKNEAGDITNAVMGAQKAADMIIREAQNSAAAEKAEADAVLVAAKNEARMIKSDAEKQAVADSDLLLSMTRDKAQEIIFKAKKEAENIINEAKASAGDQIGVATRTVTSETILYDMLKKEVSEFKANILSQYKSHIELISKLPEFAIDEAKKSDPDYAAYLQAEESQPADFEAEAASKADEIFNSVIGSADAENTENTSEDTVIEFDDEEMDDDAVIQYIKDISAEAGKYEQDDSAEAESVVETTLPYNFFDENSGIEYISDDVRDSDDIVKQGEADFKLEGNTEPALNAQPETNFTVDVDSYEFESFNADSGSADEQDIGPKDIPISRPAPINKDAIEKISEDDMNRSDDSAEPRKKVFFKRKK